jgi:hypothetical protein
LIRTVVPAEFFFGTTTIERRKGGLLMTDRTCICSGEQSKVEEESVGVRR